MFFPKISPLTTDVAYMSGNRIYRPLPNVVDVFLAKLHYAHTAFIDMYSDGDVVGSPTQRHQNNLKS